MIEIYLAPEASALKERFDALGITLAQLHRASGVSLPTIKRAFSGDPRVKAPTMTHLGAVLAEIEQRQRMNRQVPL